jgi:hypothetical protein
VATLMPIETISEFLSHGPTVALTSIIGPGGLAGIPLFWERYKQTPAGQHHPAVKNRSIESLARCLPIFFHEDGGEIYRNTEYYWFQISSALCAGQQQLQAVDIKFPFLGIPMEMMSDEKVYNGVIEEVTKYIDYQCRWGELGVRPSKGFYDEDFTSKTRKRFKNQGTNLPLNFSFIFVGWKGDGKSRKTSHRMCDRCTRSLLITSQS